MPNLVLLVFQKNSLKKKVNMPEKWSVSIIASRSCILLSGGIGFSLAGDWFWAKYTAAGKIEKEGKVSGCINCHSAVIDNDWIFTGPVK